MKVFVATPTTGTVVDSLTYALRAIEKAYAGRIELVYPAGCVRRMFHDYARNEMVNEFLATDCDVLWFLDSDVTPPTDVLDILLDGAEWEAAGAPYPVFMTPEGDSVPQVVFTVYEGKGEGVGLFPADVPLSGTAYVDGVGTGCMFLKRSVFDKVERPYFDFTYEHATRKMLEGEDLRFCRKMVALGIKFYIDFGKVCRHQKSIDLTDVNNYAITYANNSVKTYDALIKAKVAQAVKAAFNEGVKVGSAKARSSLVLPGEF